MLALVPYLLMAETASSTVRALMCVNLLILILPKLFPEL
jgi:hypothetical protein